MIMNFEIYLGQFNILQQKTNIYLNLLNFI